MRNPCRALSTTAFCGIYSQGFEARARLSATSQKAKHLRAQENFCWVQFRKSSFKWIMFICTSDADYNLTSKERLPPPLKNNFTDCKNRFFFFLLVGKVLRIWALLMCETLFPQSFPGPTPQPDWSTNAYFQLPFLCSLSLPRESSLPLFLLLRVPFLADAAPLALSHLSPYMSSPCLHPGHLRKVAECLCSQRLAQSPE